MPRGSRTENDCPNLICLLIKRMLVLPKIPRADVVPYKFRIKQVAQSSLWCSETCYYSDLLKSQKMIEKRKKKITFWNLRKNLLSSDTPLLCFCINQFSVSKDVAPPCVKGLQTVQDAKMHLKLSGQRFHSWVRQ